VTDDYVLIQERDFAPHKAISQDAAMLKLLNLAQSVARTPSTVLLSGESGVGKEVIARYIHDHSPRSSAKFVAINCAALPQSLLESELFGHEKGAFSGAVSRHLGWFERAHGGTILLDEISEVSMSMQAKLLRVLQERVMTRVGGKEQINLDIRVIATTNRNLREYVDQGKFRLDLYYRLNIFPLKIPPLRERPSDIEPVTMYYLAKYAEQFQSTIVGISNGALEKLGRYHFPGNVRELVNIIERAVILSVGSDLVTEDHLVLDDEISVESTARVMSPEAQGMVDDDLVSFLPGSEPLTEVRRKIILGTLERFGGNRTRTAEALGVSLRTIRNKLRDYRERGIEVPNPGKANTSGSGEPDPDPDDEDGSLRR